MSPLEIFRRNQKVMMTGLILLAMFAFIVLPVVSDYMARSGGPGRTDPVLAEYNGISLTASRIDQFTQQHNDTVRFLVRLGNETINRGAQPQVPGFFVDPRSGDIRSVGIEMQPGRELSIKTLQFAAAAEQQGFALDDTSLELWLEQYTGGVMSEREIFVLLRQVSENRMGEFQLFEMLRKQLLSRIYIQSASSTVARGQFPMQSPLDLWENFLQLNQSATFDAYGVLVNDYMDEVDSEPSDAEILEVYEAGKDVFPNEFSTEPGYRRLDSATFEYLVADFEKFIDAKVAKLTEEEIQAKYDEEIASGSLRWRVLPTDTATETPTETEAPESGEAPTESNETMTESGQASEAPETEGPKSETDDGTEEAASVKAFAEELEEASQLIPPAKPADTDDQSSWSPTATRLVAMQSAESTSDPQSTESETQAPPTENDPESQSQPA
ncbi:MAG: hypothetical protein AAGJ83_12915, partial [Planctomycetota bacterium]